MLRHNGINKLENAASAVGLVASQRGTTESMSEKISSVARELIAQGMDVIALNVGQPSTGAPQIAKQAIIQELNIASNILGYGPIYGLPQLRERIAQHYQENYGVAMDPQRVMITFGASGAFLLAFLALFDVGDALVLPMPCYPSYWHTIDILGLRTVEMETHQEHQFQPHVDAMMALLEREPDIRGIIVTSPGNPTGSMIKPEQLADLVAFCAEKGICVISDEIYHGITYNNAIPAATVLAYSEQVIAINSFSKYYSMPGWRLGWMVLPPQLVPIVGNLARNMYVAPPTPGQYLALAAFDAAEELDQHVQRYTLNRQKMLAGLPKAGMKVTAPPDGAFYVYADITALHSDSEAFCMQMLRQLGIAATPGIEYDSFHGHQHVRFSYAGKTSDIERAIAQLQNAYADNPHWATAVE